MYYNYRHKLLSRAALSNLYRRMKPIGTTLITAGDNPFYKKISYHTVLF